MVLSSSFLDGVTVRWEMNRPFAILSEMTKGNDWRALHEEFRTALRESR
jgi:hypothetical protein